MIVFRTRAAYGRTARILLCMLMLLVATSGCGNQEESNVPQAQAASEGAKNSESARPAPQQSAVRTVSHEAELPLSAPAPDPIVEIETSLGKITLKLNRAKAPQTVDNFLANYVEREFYEQTIFHHVEEGFLIAAGGYTADLQPKPTRVWIRNESNNGLSNVRGTVAMARQPEYPHSATSQFFINLVDNPSLDYQPDATSDELRFGYCVFGEVVAGMEVVDEIARASVRSTQLFPSLPVEPIVITGVRRIQ